MIPKIQHQTPKWVFGMGGGARVMSLLSVAWSGLEEEFCVQTNCLFGHLLDSYVMAGFLGPWTTFLLDPLPLYSFYVLFPSVFSLHQDSKLKL